MCIIKGIKHSKNYVYTQIKNKNEKPGGLVNLCRKDEPETDIKLCTALSY